MALTELARTDALRVGHLGPIFASVFYRGATIEAVQLLQKTQADFIRIWPRMFSISIIVGDRVALPSQEVRDLSAQMQKQFEPNLTGAATVLLTTGLASAISRSFLTMHALHSQVNTDTRTFRTITEAIEWARGVPDQLPELIGLPSLITDLERFAAIAPPPPATPPTRS